MDIGRIGGLAAAMTVIACDSAPGPVMPDEPELAVGQVVDLVNGSGHVQLAGQLRSFAFSASAHVDGTVRGSFELHARQADVRVHGAMVCVTNFGGSTWLGGNITSESFFQGQNLKGQDLIWRALDLGVGTKGFPDLLSLAQPRDPGGAQDFCNTTPFSPPLSLVVEQGNITVNTPGTTSFSSVAIIDLVDFPVFIPCADNGTGELALLTGPLQLLFHFNDDRAGGFHAMSETNPQNLSGYGQTTGDLYQGTGNTGGHTNFSISGLPFTDTFVNNFRIIGQGPGNNFLVHTTVHFTVNANGEVTANVFNGSVECR